MIYSAAAVALFAATAALACEGDVHDHGHSHSKRISPTIPTGITAPTRPLVWGDLNIIHTTDSHGWLLGHQHTSEPEPNYSGTFGDFASFVEHMKNIALEKDVDLLLVDSGDLHDGTGLTDGYPAGGIDAHDANQFFKKLPYDLLAIGNHELYDYINTYDMYTNFAPHFNGRYLSSNVNITVEQNGKNVSVPVGDRFAKFTTRKGRKVTSLGVLYDFTGNDHNTTVQPVKDMVTEEWFAEAIQEEPDFFLLAGHMPVSEDNWPAVFNAVRAVHAETPIIILGGHTHIRDCNQPDGRSMALESGRYMETVGFLSADLNDAKNTKGNLTFNRRYLDPNRITYEFHTQTNQHDFDTALGTSITSGLEGLAVQFDLSYLYGVAPEDFFLTRVPVNATNSIVSLFIEKAAPIALAINNTRADVPNIMLTNTGEQRFDIYAGNFTKNDQLTSLPFADSFLYIPNITLAVAEQILPGLNREDDDDSVVVPAKRGLKQREEQRRSLGFVDHRYNRWLREMSQSWSDLEKRTSETQNATIGYVTDDRCPGVGDDTVHLPLPFFDQPDYVASNAPNVTTDAPIDLVFINFIEDDVLEVLNKAQSDKTYTDADVLSYSPVLASAVFGLYAQVAWN